MSYDVTVRDILRHPGMVCICGKVVSDNLKSLLDHKLKTIPLCTRDDCEIRRGYPFVLSCFESRHVFVTEVGLH